MRRLLAVVLLMLAAPAAFADDFRVDCTGAACRQAFHEAVKDVAATLNFKVLGPAEPTGLLGLSVAGVGTYVPVENKDAWRTLSGRDIDEIGMVGGVVTKGLPAGFDVGFFYATIPSSGGGAAYGAQLRYAILEGGVASPALAVEANYTSTNNIDDFDYNAWGADVILSKGFAFLTPYIGGGIVSATIDPTDPLKDPAGANLKSEDVTQGRFFVGARISMLFFNITPEYERFGDNNVYNLRVGFSL
ncbi:MAG: DUF6588 family protein [Solimonas sp.]